MANIVTLRLPFSEDEVRDAYAAWGCSCGPAALAAVLDRPLDYVRLAVEAAGFSRTRNYLSPSMMQAALRHLGVRWWARDVIACDRVAFPHRGLVRVQWEGPWTAPGANPRWAYRHTHWIASWKVSSDDAPTAIYNALNPVVFDINGGLMDFDRWEEEIVPLITQSIPRADGDWHVTHSLEIEL